MLCKNCFTPITDKYIECSVCGEQLHPDCVIKDKQNYCDVCYTVKEEEGTKIEFEVPDVIRRSYIELYRACPFKFYHEIIKGIQSPTNIYAQLGIDLHVLFDKACQERMPINEMRERFEVDFDHYTNELFGDVNREKMYKRGLDCIDTFYKVIDNMPTTPYKTEETIQYSIGEGLPLVQTTSDRIDLIDGELEMVDWKTGKVMVGEKLSTDLQAPLYIQGVRDKYKLPVRKFTFYYLEENKLRVFERINNDEYLCTVNKRQYYINVTDGIREVQTIFSHIKKGDFNIPKNTKGMYYTCKYCHIKELEICKGAEIQSWKQHNGKGWI